jgi:hypothetical protein
MENLTENVYECTLAVEAHMICDLLARAGISARVDGEFLAGAGGELPLGNTIRVRVEPSRAAEARQVIDEWEKLQPLDEPGPPPKRSNWRSPLWFFCGAVVGGSLVFLGLRTPLVENSVDLDDDGIVDENYIHAGQILRAIEYDRNADRKIDARWIHDLRTGVVRRYEGDDDFDGRFERQSDVERGWPARDVLDTNGDGKPEETVSYTFGVVRKGEIYDDAGERIVVRELYDNGRVVTREFDNDGDGTFERRVEYDRFGEPLTK